jgi:hypothetical protein
MPKAEKGTPKDIANRMKAKGLQKLVRKLRVLHHIDELCISSPTNPIPLFIPTTIEILLPNVQQAMPRRKRIQMSHPIRFSPASNEDIPRKRGGYDG